MTKGPCGCDLPQQAGWTTRKKKRGCPSYGVTVEGSRVSITRVRLVVRPKANYQKGMHKGAISKNLLKNRKKTEDSSPYFPFLPYLSPYSPLTKYKVTPSSADSLPLPPLKLVSPPFILLRGVCQPGYTYRRRCR